MDTPLESELVDIVDLIADKKRGEALDKINDYLYGKAQDVIDQYKQSVKPGATLMNLQILQKNETHYRKH